MEVQPGRAGEPGAGLLVGGFAEARWGEGKRFVGVEEELQAVLGVYNWGWGRRISETSIGSLQASPRLAAQDENHCQRHSHFLSALDLTLDHFWRAL